VFKRRSAISLCSHEMRFMVMFNYDFLVVENDDTKNNCLNYHACVE
jgi:hypothetical protein